MPKSFNTTAICIPEMHYMVNIESRLKEISQLVDTGKYFVEHQRLNVNNNSDTNALVHGAVLPERYASAIVAQNLW